MTDLEKAVSKWLPEVWQPGRKCEWRCHDQAKDAQFMMLCQCGAIDLPSREHDIPCPPLTRDLAVRMLEALLRAGALMHIQFAEGSFRLDDQDYSECFEGGDLSTAIIKAAAALAEKDQ